MYENKTEICLIPSHDQVGGGKKSRVQLKTAVKLDKHFSIK